MGDHHQRGKGYCDPQPWAQGVMGDAVPKNPHGAVCRRAAGGNSLDDDGASVDAVSGPPGDAEVDRASSQGNSPETFLQWISGAGKEVQNTLALIPHGVDLLKHRLQSTDFIPGDGGESNGSRHSQKELNEIGDGNTPEAGHQRIGQADGATDSQCGHLVDVEEHVADLHGRQKDPTQDDGIGQEGVKHPQSGSQGRSFPAAVTQLGEFGLGHDPQTSPVA